MPKGAYHAKIGCRVPLRRAAREGQHKLVEQSVDAVSSPSNSVTPKPCLTATQPWNRSTAGNQFNLFPYSDSDDDENELDDSSRDEHRFAHHEFDAEVLASTLCAASPLSVAELKMESVSSWSSTISRGSSTDAGHSRVHSIPPSTVLQGSRSGESCTSFDALNARLDDIRERNRPLSLVKNWPTPASPRQNSTTATLNRRKRQRTNEKTPNVLFSKTHAFRRVFPSCFSSKLTESCLQRCDDDIDVFATCDEAARTC